MFSSTTTTLSLNNNNNMSPFPQYYFSPLSSSSSSPPPLDYNNHNLSQTQSQVQFPLSDRYDHIFFHQHDQYDSAFLFHNNNINIPEVTQISFGPSNTNNIMGSCFYSKQENNQVPMINDSKVSNEVPILGRKKKPAASKKDRHSKIHTAQGLRDRRVRLSIEIAREFFDLHDTLGFDKASKTLEWLLRKSNKAIVELSRSVSKSFSSATTNCQSEIDQVVSTEELDQTLDQRADPAPRSKASALKESRAKARARARARTREKKKCNSPGSSGDGTKRIEKWHNSGSQILGQLMEANYQLVRDHSSDSHHRMAIRQDRDQSGETSTTKKIGCGGQQKLKFPDWISNSSTTSPNEQPKGFRTMPFGETYNLTTCLPQNWDGNCTVSPWSSFSLRT